MDNTTINLYREAFKKVFGDKIENFESYEFKVTPKWDSMAQIALISTLEDIFDVNFEMEDIFDFKSYEGGKELLSDKFNIKF